VGEGELGEEAVGYQMPSSSSYFCLPLQKKKHILFRISFFYFPLMSVRWIIILGSSNCFSSSGFHIYLWVTVIFHSYFGDSVHICFSSWHDLFHSDPMHMWTMHTHTHSYSNEIPISCAYTDSQLPTVGPLQQQLPTCCITPSLLCNWRAGVTWLFFSPFTLPLVCPHMLMLKNNLALHHQILLFPSLSDRPRLINLSIHHFMTVIRIIV